MSTDIAPITEKFTDDEIELAFAAIVALQEDFIGTFAKYLGLKPTDYVKISFVLEDDEGNQTVAHSNAFKWNGKYDGDLAKYAIEEIIKKNPLFDEKALLDYLKKYKVFLTEEEKARLKEIKAMEAELAFLKEEEKRDNAEIVSLKLKKFMLLHYKQK